MTSNLIKNFKENLEQLEWIAQNLGRNQLSISGSLLVVFPYRLDDEESPSAAAGTRSQWLAHLKLKSETLYKVKL